MPARRHAALCAEGRSRAVTEALKGVRMAAEWAGVYRPLLHVSNEIPPGHSHAWGNSEQTQAGWHEIGERPPVRELHAVDREEKRYRVRRVRGVRARAVRLEHLLSVAMVCGDEAGSAETLDRRDHAPEAGVHGLHRSDHRRDHAGVPDHVRVREVDDREAIAVADLLLEPACDFVRRHL